MVCSDPARNTRWWHVEGEGDAARVVCTLCPRHCRMAEGKRGFCFVRQNQGGRLVLTTYGRSTGFCIDPIEKKPLNHFLPGTPVLSFGTAGCNLGCQFCQNWDISKARDIERASAHAMPDAIVESALQSRCRSIAFTYNDPTTWAEYVIDTARVARQEGIKTVAVTAGYIGAEARAEMYEHIDAANVDLKAFTEQFYKKLTLSHLQPVLDTLTWLRRETGVWFEITTLLIPGHNDSDEEIMRLSDWILNELGDDVPLHFTAFHPDYKMMDTPATPPSTLTRARDLARSTGLKFVYTGNTHDPAGQSTYCPGCGKVVIERDWYELGRYHLDDSRCGFCGTAIPGIFEAAPGHWGRRRVPLMIHGQ
jgi:AmmeMemoRadiSam system radical SAM enzyme